MHEDAPKMSVAPSLAASTSQPKSDIVTEVQEFVMSTSEAKSTEPIELELKINYLDEAAGKYLLAYIKSYLLNTYIHLADKSYFPH